MGTEDYYVKFGTDADQDKWVEGDWTQTGSLYWQEYSERIRYQNAGGGFYIALARNVPTEQWDMTVRMWASDSASPKYHSIYIKLDDGYYYVVGSYSSTAEYAKIGWKRTLTRPINAATNVLTAGANVGVYELEERWWGLRFKTDGSIDAIEAAIVGNERDPPTMDVVNSNIFTGITAKRIEEVGFLGEGNGSATMFYRIKIDADTWTPRLLYGTAEVGNVRNISTTKTFGGGGGANIFSTYDANTVDEADIRSNYRKSIIVLDAKYEKERFVGEINYIDIIRDADIFHVNYRAVEDIRKLTKQFCRTTPVLLSSEVKSVKDNILYDYQPTWTVNEFANKIMTTTDKDLYHNYVSPVSVADYINIDSFDLDPSTWAASNLEAEGGSVNNLYFHDVDQSGNDAYGAVGARGFITDPYTHIFVFTYKVWVKDGTNLATTQAIAEIIARWNSFKPSRVWGSSDDWYPKFLIFNYDTTFYELIWQYTRDNHSNSDVGDTDSWLLNELSSNADYNSSSKGAGKSPIFTDKIGVVLSDDYLVNESAVNDAGFKSYNFKLALSFTAPDLDPTFLVQRYPILEMHQLVLDFNYETAKLYSQGQSYSNGKIASNTANTITLDNTANASISVVDFPQADGVTKGDEYYISDNLEDIISDIFSTADTDFIYETDWDNDYTTYGEIADIYDTSIHNYLKKVSGMNNWAFWSTSTKLLSRIKIADNFDSTGITLTENDIMNYSEGGLDLQENAKNMYDKVTVIGANGVRVTKTTSADYNDTLGNEEIIYRNNELYTKRNIEAYVDTKILLHKSILYDVVLTLDLTDPYQSYEEIDIGKTVAINTSELSTANIGQELVIESMVYTSMEATGGREFLTLHLQRRL